MSRIRKVLYIAAHGGFAGADVPLGGGAAIFNLLTEEWARTKPFELKTVTPAILGSAAPGARNLISFSESEYARFCHAFRAKATEAALAEDPSETALLINDVSEGPDFRWLRQAGFHIVTIYHVDVVAYIAAIYLKGRLAPRMLTRAWRMVARSGIGRFAPSILRLIFEQQQASVEYSSAIVTPSAGMKEILLGCYPATPSGRICPIPWGAPAPRQPLDGVDRRVRELRQEQGIEDGARILLCLSRISPEKGQDTLLEALAEWEKRLDFPEHPVRLIICGEPAFMKGEAFARKLRRLAAKLRKVRVTFPGYVSGVEKAAYLALADLYVFPSRHESYGLTLMEALAAGLPAVALDQQGSREIIRPEFGAIVPAGSPAQVRAGLIAAIARHLESPREAMRETARRYAAERPFEVAAAKLSELLLSPPDFDKLRAVR